MAVRDDNPKAFISYSWSSPKHEEFVLQLAERLMSDGVRVLLDKWDLKEGHDKYVFMEQMVTDSNASKVLIISDKKYAEKADSRKGGVGTESQIISDKVYSKVKQEKFIPIVTEYDDSSPCIPAFLKSRIYIDFSEEERFHDEYEKLLRNIYDRPLNVKPAIGKAPSHIFTEEPRSIKTLSVFARLKDSIEKEKKSYRAFSKDFLSQTIEVLESYKIDEFDNFDDKIIETIEDFRPYRDQFVSFIMLACKYELIDNLKDEIFIFFERLLELHDQQEINQSYNENWFDNYKFISMELFLYLVTCLVKEKQFDVVDFYLSEKYLQNTLNGKKPRSYCEFNSYLRSLEEFRKNRLKLNTSSITADLLHNSIGVENISFDDLMQTDFILSVRSIFKDSDFYERWFPRTLAYRRMWNAEPFELFLRAESPRHFEVVKKVLNVNSKQDIVNRLAKAQEAYNLKSWRLDYEAIPFKSLLNIDNLPEG